MGRFAPSPSGPLHFGSLVAAVGSYLQAKSANGRWLIRIEDLDTPRIVAGASEHILRTLEAFGFQWDGAIEFQSRRKSFYEGALQSLTEQNAVYLCSCSRSEIAASEEQRYVGTCRTGARHADRSMATRFKVNDGIVEFYDRLQGRFAQDVANTCGDFVVKRRDGIFAYHLAVVVDDADQGITEIVRGADLLDSTPRQLLLQKALKVATPQYCHLPLAVDSLGQKLSKSSQSLPIDAKHAAALLWEALVFLRQSPPPLSEDFSIPDLWRWARTHWTLAPLRRLKSDCAPPATEIHGRP